MSMLTIPQTIILKQMVMGKNSMLELRELLGEPVERIRYWIEDLCKRLGVQTMHEALHLTVRGGDYPIDFEPEFNVPYDREAARARTEQRKKLKNEVCRFIADYHQQYGVYALFDDVRVKFKISEDETLKVLEALDRTCYIEIIKKGGQRELRPLARP